MKPVEPPSTSIAFPDPSDFDDVVATGTDFRPGTILAAYRRGIFPWPQPARGGRHVVCWCSPDPRTIFPIDKAPTWSRSLTRTLRKHTFDIRIDTAFSEVMHACGEREEGTWILPELQAGYEELHRLGWAHSLEVWDGPHLVGGIYGIAIGGMFAGESMFHRRTDASKIAFASLVAHLRTRGFTLFDAQVMNDHLASLGCIEVPREEFLSRLSTAAALDTTFL